jgi:hypothetical protein
VDFKLTVVANETQLPELVHEKVNTRASCAYHLRKSFLTDVGNCNFGLSVLAEVSKQEENASKPFLARIEKLINQILFVPHVPYQQIRHEHVGKSVLSMNYRQHGLLVDPHHRTIGHCSCEAQAKRLSGKATFSEEIACIQYPYRSFLSALGHDGEFYLSRLDVKNGIGWITLNKDRLLLDESCDLSAAIDGRKESLDIEFSALLGSYCCGRHDQASPQEQSIKAKRAREMCRGICDPPRQEQSFHFSVPKVKDMLGESRLLDVPEHVSVRAHKVRPSSCSPIAEQPHSQIGKIAHLFQTLCNSEQFPKMQLS